MEGMYKHIPKCLQSRAAVIVVPAIHPDNAWPMGRSVWTVVRSITSEKSAEADTTVHNTEQEPDQHNVEDHTDMVNINLIIFNSKWLVLTANLKMSSHQVSIIIPYKVDTGSDGNIMPLHLYKKLLPRATKEQLVATKNKIIQLKMYNKTAISQLGICKVKIQHGNAQKMCKFFVDPGNGQALLGMPDINMLNIINLNFNTIDTHRTEIAGYCSTNTVICQSVRHVQHYTNIMQEADRAMKCYANTDSISKFDNKDKPMVTDKEPNTINYFLPGLN